MNVGTAAVSPDPAGRGAQREKPRATSALSGQNRRMTSPALDDLRMPAGRRVEPAHGHAPPGRGGPWPAEPAAETSLEAQHRRSAARRGEKICRGSLAAQTGARLLG